jgi:hypothetical protein
VKVFTGPVEADSPVALDDRQSINQTIRLLTALITDDQTKSYLSYYHSIILSDSSIYVYVDEIKDKMEQDRTEYKR